MSLLICPECQKEVSEFAEKCISCGCPIEIIKKNQQKRLYTIINGDKKDVTYFVNKILDNSYQQDVLNFNIKLMNDLDVSMLGFVKAVKECNGAPVEYNDKSIKQWKQKQQAIQASKPKCPMCGSTNISKIGSLNRAASIAGFGILSRKIGKQWQCNNPKCRHLW